MLCLWLALIILSRNTDGSKLGGAPGQPVLITIACLDYITHTAYVLFCSFVLHRRLSPSLAATLLMHILLYVNVRGISIVVYSSEMGGFILPPLAPFVA